MNEKDDDIAHPGRISKPQKHPILAQLSNSLSTPAKNGAILAGVGRGQ
jgi:hypothetical protein